jgi:hypothetical protein
MAARAVAHVHLKAESRHNLRRRAHVDNQGAPLDAPVWPKCDVVEAKDGNKLQRATLSEKKRNIRGISGSAFT